MTTTEKLEHIKNKCREIIALGEKRMHGRWKVVNLGQGSEVLCVTQEEGNQVYNHYVTETGSANAAFIAACAGPAEAMARSTIAAIDGAMDQHQHANSIRQFLKVNSQYWNDLQPHLYRIEKQAKCLTDIILAAWPDELVTRNQHTP